MVQKKSNETRKPFVGSFASIPGHVIARALEGIMRLTSLKVLLYCYLRVWHKKEVYYYDRGHPVAVLAPGMIICSPTEIARDLGASRSAVQSALADLERLGVIKRECLVKSKYGRNYRLPIARLATLESGPLSIPEVDSGDRHPNPERETNTNCALRDGLDESFGEDGDDPVRPSEGGEEPILSPVRTAPKPSSGLPGMGLTGESESSPPQTREESTYFIQNSESGKGSHRHHQEGKEMSNDPDYTMFWSIKEDLQIILDRPITEEMLLIREREENLWNARRPRPPIIPFYQFFEELDQLPKTIEGGEEVDRRIREFVARVPKNVQEEFSWRVEKCWAAFERKQDRKFGIFDRYGWWRPRSWNTLEFQRLHHRKKSDVPYINFDRLFESWESLPASNQRDAFYRLLDEFLADSGVPRKHWETLQDRIFEVWQIRRLRKKQLGAR